MMEIFLAVRSPREDFLNLAIILGKAGRVTIKRMDLNDRNDWKRARMLKHEGRLKDAIALLDTIVSRSAERDLLNLGKIKAYLASLHLESRSFDEGVSNIEHAIRIEREWGDAGLETVSLADYSLLLARLQEARGRWKDAYYAAIEALASYEDLLGAENDFVRGVKRYCQTLKDNQWRS